MGDEKASQCVNVARCKTFVRGLDDRMEGGIPENYIILVCGHAGTMKSTLAYSILYNQAREGGRKGLYITLEQSRDSLLLHMTKLGLVASEGDITVKDMEDLAVVDISKLRKETKDKPKGENAFNWVDSILNTVKAFQKQFGCNSLVVDSLAALYALHKFKNPRADLFHLFEQLRGLGMTVYLISEIPAGEEWFGIYGVEDFLADGIFHLDIERQGRNVNLFLGIVKMRMTHHDRSYYPLIFEDSGFEVIQD